MAFSTNYFRPFFFEAVVTVNLTSLLVLTTLFISVSNSLPTTSYVKLMDIWLIFCLLVPFSETILQVFRLSDLTMFYQSKDNLITFERIFRITQDYLVCPSNQTSPLKHLFSSFNSFATPNYKSEQIVI